MLFHFNENMLKWSKVITMQRLQKLIAQTGYCSRRKAEEMIQAGKVKVNGQVIVELGSSFPENVTIEIDGQVLRYETKKVYYLLNKPRNYITSAKDDRDRPTVLDLVPNDVRIYPVGRLDFDATGALLLTNDGDLTNRLIHPRYEVEKVYVVTVSRKIPQEHIQKIIQGVVYEGQTIRASDAALIKYNANQDHSIVKVLLKEGKNHQVKNLFEALGYKVIKLNRESFAGISTVGLKQGQYRSLSKEEVLYLQTRQQGGKP